MPYSEEIKKAIPIAQSLAKEYRNELYGPAHLLQAILHNEIGLASWLVARGKDIHYMREWAEIRMESSPKSGRTPENPAGDEKAAATLELADLIALQLNSDHTNAVSLLAAILKPGVAFTQDQLKTFPLTQKEVMDAVVHDNASAASAPPTKHTVDGNGGTANARSAGNTPPSNALYTYCVDKTALAEEGKLDPIIGRDRELRMLLEVLGRRTKPNVIIIGEPGVGKTALVEGFAQVIVQGLVTTPLRNARLYELDMGALVAGASYKGEVEDRIKNILKEIKQFEKAILFIDEIHLLLDSKGSIGTGVVNLLKPELARGEITMLGATTQAEYRKYIETDEAFCRRFELVQVPEPDADTAVTMLSHVMGIYEKHHQLKVEKDAIVEAVNMAKRYSRDRRLPDAAVDILDRTMSAIKMMGDTSKRELEVIKASLDNIIATHKNNPAAFLQALKSWQKELKDRISPLLFHQLGDEAQVPDEDLEIPEALADHYQRQAARLLELAGPARESVSRNDIAVMTAYKTGIPVGKIQNAERDKLLNADEVLKKRVVGQDHAIRSVVEAILESRSGLIKGNQPIASFFLLGPTGTGKTELAKSLADFLFNDEQYLIRFDMSEFKEEHSAALLYGAPPGYVGYENGGLLVNRIREKPYSVVLFDEIEKAHPSVYDLFLQILDEGKLHDRLGKEGDFTNAIVLFTSNIGSEFIAGKFGQGSIPTATEMMEIMAGHFRPEFLARLTEIVPFAPISEENVVRIFDIHLRSLTDPLNKQGVTLTISPEAKRHLSLSGFTPKYGARQIKSVIRNQLRRPISRRIIAGELIKGSSIALDLDESTQLQWTITPPHTETAAEAHPPKMGLAAAAF